MATQKIKITEVKNKKNENAKTIVLTKKNSINNVNKDKKVIVISKKKRWCYDRKWYAWKFNKS